LESESGSGNGGKVAEEENQLLMGKLVRRRGIRGEGNKRISVDVGKEQLGEEGIDGE
jgi:hypothetical protein